MRITRFTRTTLGKRRTCLDTVVRRKIGITHTRPDRYLGISCGIIRAFARRLPIINGGFIFLRWVGLVGCVGGFGWVCGGWFWVVGWFKLVTCVSLVARLAPGDTIFNLATSYLYIMLDG